MKSACKFSLLPLVLAVIIAGCGSDGLTSSQGETGTVSGSGSGSDPVIPPPLPTPSSIVGIPAPGFCYDEVAPSAPANWPGAEAPGYYYVDNTHVSATDTSNTYGYPDKPRRSIPTTLAAGSYVEISGGPYSSASVTVTASGTSADPVWIRGNSALARPTLQRSLSVRGTYAIVENLRFDTNSNTLRVGSSGSASTDHICLRNNEFSGPGTNNGNNAVVSVSGSAAFPTTNVVIYSNLIHGFGNWQDAAENDYHGILPASYAHYVWVINNHVYNMGGDSIQVGQANYTVAERPKYVYIGGNYFHDDRENAVDIKSAEHVIVSSNVMHTYRSVSSSSGEVVAIHDDPSYVWILFNTVYDGRIGIISTGSSDTWFIGNVIRDMLHGTSTSWNGTSLYSLGVGIHFRGNTTGGAVHNTLYNYDSGIQIPQGGGTTGYVIRNNIFAGRAESGGLDAGVEVNNTTFDNNLVYGQGGAIRILWNGNTHTSLTSFKSTGKCANCPATADPLFYDTAADDFRIPSNSPAANTGAADPVYDTFFNIYGIAIDKDKAGNPRAFGTSAPDIGAYESDAP
jgi:hypothetical protein